MLAGGVAERAEAADFGALAGVAQDHGGADTAGEAPAKGVSYRIARPAAIASTTTRSARSTATLADRAGTVSPRMSTRSR